MRKKEPCVILTFPSTTDAIAMESYAAIHMIPGRLIPVPTVITAGCGMCWKAPLADRQQVEQAAQEAVLRTEGIYELVI